MLKYRSVNLTRKRIQKKGINFPIYIFNYDS